MAKVNMMTPENLRDFVMFPRGVQVKILENDRPVAFGTVVNHEVDREGKLFIWVEGPSDMFYGEPWAGTTTHKVWPENLSKLHK